MSDIRCDVRLLCEVRQIPFAKLTARVPSVNRDVDIHCDDADDNCVRDATW